jgi:glutathione S-transferase
MSEPAITLYRLQACPYCERVVKVLSDFGIEYRSRFVEPMHSDRDVVKRLTGVRTVPVIVDENTGVTMAESANIVEYLERTYGNDGPLAGHHGEATRTAVSDGGA